MIRIDDIAGGLSRICRFGGQAREFYSVAQHAVLVRQLVYAAGLHNLGLVALHHDSHEAYACDLPSPLKRYLRASNELSAYERLAAALDEAIGSAFGIPLGQLNVRDRRALERADRAAFQIEARRLLPNGGVRAIQDDRYPRLSKLPPCPDPLMPAAASQAFLDAHLESSERAAA